MRKLFVMLLTLSIICLSNNLCHSGSYWARTYGSNGSEYAESVQQTTDGGYIVAGFTNSSGAGGWDLWILKLDSIGDITWQKTYGGSNDDSASSVQQTTDGGYIIGGVTDSFGAGQIDSWILKISDIGEVTWQKTYGDASTDVLSSIQETTDGGYIATGKMGINLYDYDLGLMKIDSNGDITWERRFGWYAYEAREEAYSIYATSDGGYILSGTTYSSGAGFWDFWIIKINDIGGNPYVQWQKTYGGVSSEYAKSIQQTADEGYIVAGYTNSFGAGNRDLWITKLDNNGDITWQKTYGGGADEYAESVKQTADGGYIVAGYTYSFGAGNYDGWLIKLDSNGDISWEKTYGGTGDDRIQALETTSDGGYIAAGYTGSSGFGSADLWVLRLDSNGEMPSCTLINNSSCTVSDTSASELVPNPSVYVTSLDVTESSIIPEDSSSDSVIVCYSSITDEDTDADGIPDYQDNCPDHPNGSEMGTCTSGTELGLSCLDDIECGTGGYCSMSQEDTSPPDGNGIGDVCECEGDFDCDGDCDGTDAAMFKNDFGRSTFQNPCPACVQ